MHWRRKWQPTPVFLPGESQGQGSLVGCCPWGRTESDTTEATWQQQQQDKFHLLGVRMSLGALCLQECEGEKSWTGPPRKKGWAVWLVRITDIGLEYHCSAAVVFKRSLVLLTVEVLWRNLGGEKKQISGPRAKFLMWLL